MDRQYSIAHDSKNLILGNINSEVQNFELLKLNSFSIGFEWFRGDQ